MPSAGMHDPFNNVDQLTGVIYHPLLIPLENLVNYLQALETESQASLKSSALLLACVGPLSTGWKGNNMTTVGISVDASVDREQRFFSYNDVQESMTRLQIHSKLGNTRILLLCLASKLIKPLTSNACFLQCACHCVNGVSLYMNDF